MSGLPNDMDLKKMVAEIRSLHVKVDGMIETLRGLSSLDIRLSSLDKKVDEIAKEQQIQIEIVRKSANALNVITMLLDGLPEQEE